MFVWGTGRQEFVERNVYSKVAEGHPARHKQFVRTMPHASPRSPCISERTAIRATLVRPCSR